MNWNWQGDLRDDCTAVGHGLMLRAEMMAKACWWWAVYSNEGTNPGAEQIAASHDEPPYRAVNGKTARNAAEQAAERYLARVSEGNGRE